MPTKTKPNKIKPTLVAFLLDRTGSMMACRDEAILGFNAYINELKKKADNISFTLTQFDSISIDIIHNAVPMGKVNRLTDETYQPRANTPLYDAIGKTIKATQEKANGKKVLFVTLTDGQENASSEYTIDMVRSLIKEMESKHKWTFAHIGTGTDGWNAARAYSAGTASASNVLHTDHKNIKRSFARAAGQSVSYACSTSSGEAPMVNFWGDADDSKEKEKGC